MKILSRTEAPFKHKPQNFIVVYTIIISRSRYKIYSINWYPDDPSSPWRNTHKSTSRQATSINPIPEGIDIYKVALSTQTHSNHIHSILFSPQHTYTHTKKLLLSKFPIRQPHHLTRLSFPGRCWVTCRSLFV
jgi:hypothetical protein